MKNGRSKQITKPKQSDSDKKYSPTNTIRAVVFDFGGTLTKGHKDGSTWETIWIRLGYDIQECKKLHEKFSKNEITHHKWCEVTEKYFKEKNLNVQMINDIAKEIHLIDGCEETFIELQKRNIKIFIVSGSILIIIQNILKHLLQYVDEVKANDFVFSSDGLLTKIIGTRFDFQGKSRYIRSVAHRLNISTKDILFIGNSSNDKYAHLSGANTLCINPDKVDTTNFKVWNHNIEKCENLKQIFEEKDIKDLLDNSKKRFKDHIDNIRLKELMLESIEEAKKSMSEGDSKKHPKVGAILADIHGKILLRAHRGQAGPGTHCEYSLLTKAEEEGIDCSQTILFVTLEPCSKRGEGKTPCAIRIINKHVPKVYVGSIDRNPEFRSKGLQDMQDAGIIVEHYPDELNAKIRDMNKDFENQFTNKS
jgi:HAD superfamily phosphoserine phosphatase-like hydrolase